MRNVVNGIPVHVPLRAISKCYTKYLGRSKRSRLQCRVHIPGAPPVESILLSASQWARSVLVSRHPALSKLYPSRPRRLAPSRFRRARCSLACLLAPSASSFPLGLFSSSLLVSANFFPHFAPLRYLRYFRRLVQIARAGLPGTLSRKPTIDQHYSQLSSC